VTDVEGQLFGALNALMEPVARAGLLSRPVCPLGVISLETIGRRSGVEHRVPVMAMAAGEYVIVATVRGRRSDWFRNLEAKPEARYWLDGEEHKARAVVLGKRQSASLLPPAVAGLAASMTAHAQLMGWRFAVLIPDQPAALEV
jgi:deazaflavin-dependent oxidoreductase (nitroreductase family)